MKKLKINQKVVYLKEFLDGGIVPTIVTVKETFKEHNFIYSEELDYVLLTKYILTEEELKGMIRLLEESKDKNKRNIRLVMNAIKELEKDCGNEILITDECEYLEDDKITEKEILETIDRLKLDGILFSPIKGFISRVNR